MKNVAVPNFFYDLIVFVSPSILLIVGLILGLSDLSFSVVKSFSGNIGAIDVLIIVFAFLFIAYEYGRLAEALSHTFVARLIKMFTKFFLTKKLFKSTDYNLDFTKAVSTLELSTDLPHNKNNNKWTIYFYALLHSPHIGQDLLKRYAWEKLSRSSAFTFFLLFIISIIFYVTSICGAQHTFIGHYGFGSYTFTIIVFILTISTFYEYYKRKCWNNDLLIKVLPILINSKDKDTKKYIFTFDK